MPIGVHLIIRIITNVGKSLMVNKLKFIRSKRKKMHPYLKCTDNNQSPTGRESQGCAKGNGVTYDSTFVFLTRYFSLQDFPTT